MTRVRPSRALRTRIGLGLTVFCLAGPAVEAASAEDGGSLGTSPELAGGAIEAALETVAALSSAELATTDPSEALPTDALAAAAVTEELQAPVAASPDTTPVPDAPPPPPEAVTEAPAPIETPIETPSAISTEPVEQEATPLPASDEPAATEAVSPEPAPSPASATATQLQPGNVNVSIRIDSPGDNGAVEQVNAAIAAVGAPPSAAAPEQYQPEPAQYQPSQTPAQPSAAPPASPAAAAPTSGWNWTWTCGGEVTEVLPAGGSGTYLPENWNWNWNWNCGDGATADGNNNPENIGQYHPGVTQYQPINLNISIRINSPGNDGSVTQANVAVIVIAPPVVTVPNLSLAVATLPSAGSDDGAPNAGTAETAPVLELAGVELSVLAEAADAAEWIFWGSSAPFGVDDAVARRAENDSLVARPARERDTDASAARTAPRYLTSTSALGLRAVAVVRAQESVRPDRPARSKTPRKPSRRPAPPMRAPVLASGFAGASPGGTDGGGWPLLALLLVPFSLALVDSTRRMGRDAALPAAAELRTRRDRPG